MLGYKIVLGVLDKKLQGKRDIFIMFVTNLNTEHPQNLQSCSETR